MIPAPVFDMESYFGFTFSLFIMALCKVLLSLKCCDYFIMFPWCCLNKLLKIQDHCDAVVF